MVAEPTLKSGREYHWCVPKGRIMALATRLSRQPQELGELLEDANIRDLDQYDAIIRALGREGVLYDDWNCCIPDADSMRMLRKYCERQAKWWVQV